MSKADTGRYTDTINLLKTDFSMRANAAEREPQIQQFWEEQQIYEGLAQNNPGEPFIIHDGPPYSNGDLHMGHALNKVLKDIINRYQLLRGRKVRYIPGWDCHGLPIELKVLQSLSSEERAELTPMSLRERAREWALEQVNQQRQGFKRFGVWGEWDNPYLTLKPEYEAAQLAVFGQMFLKGYIYRGFKPVHWSPSSRTALAEAELEYPEGHVSPSLYGAFRVTSLPPAVQTYLQEYVPDLGLAIWTTTPWTIPGNLAVAVNGKLTYAIVDTGRDNLSAEAQHQPPRYLVVASDLVDSLSALWQTPLTVIARVMGSALEGATYRHPLYDRESPVVIGGDYITTESGTGLVHTAPGHGQEDFIVGQKYHLPVLCPVDEVGNFTPEAGRFAGLNVLKDANEAVTTALEEAGSLILRHPYEHRYPYDWRTKKPTIFRATEQWFASVDGFRAAAMQAIEAVEWIPAQGQNRITSMVGERSDWCISRQRSWGVPIPVFYHRETGETLINADTLSHIQEIVAKYGADAWWQLTEAELLPEAYREVADQYRKGTDTMDVWFDSGSSWAAVVQQSGLKYPVDLYLEGSDQHRGWFQSSLLTSVAVNGHAPYQRVLTHGFALDEKGHKMSKSLGNVVDPLVIINGGKDQKKDPAYGADVLRLWVSSVDYSSDVPIGRTILKQLADVYRKIRNTARYLLGNLHDFNPHTDAVPYDQLPELDRYLLHRMGEVFTEVTDAFEKFQFYRFFQTIQNFCVVDLSNFYLDIAKDRLYISAPKDFRRRSCQTVLAIAIENLAKAIAPVLCHMAEDIWQNLPYREITGATPSVFQAGWISIDSQWSQPELAQKWQHIRKVRVEVNKVLEQARTDKAIGASLEAQVLLYVEEGELRQTLEALNPVLITPTSSVAEGSLVADSSVPDTPLTETSVAETLVPSNSVPSNSVPSNSVSSNSVVNDSVVSDDRPHASEPVSAATPSEEMDTDEAVVVKAEVVSENRPVEVLQTLREYWHKLQQSAQENRQTFTLVAVLVAVLVVLNVLSALLSALDALPLLPGFLQIVGLIFTVWFTSRKLIPSQERQNLLAQLDHWRKATFGKPRWADQPVEPFVEEPIEQPSSVSTPSVVSPEPVEPSVPEPVVLESVVPESTLTPTVNPESVVSESVVPEPSAAELTPVLPGNGVDELRYLFIASAVQLIQDPAELEGLPHHLLSEGLGVGIVKAAGTKCDRCWNYSLFVGQFSRHPDLCERCVTSVD